MQISDRSDAAESPIQATAVYETSAYEASLSLIDPLSWVQSRLKLAQSMHVQAGLAAAFLVAVPVFVQAPLVRLFPIVSLGLTAVWLMLGGRLLQMARSISLLSLSKGWTLENGESLRYRLWGELIIGFSWTWLAGGIYWGWFRTNPYIHLPIEAVSLPIVLVLLRYRKANIGNFFYLGSLLGTAITDLYFYCVGLIPAWKALMTSPPSAASDILHSALLRMGTYEGVGYAIVLLALLLMLGTIPLRTTSPKWWAFGGAVLSTILVDSLFFAAALLS